MAYSLPQKERNDLIMKNRNIIDTIKGTINNLLEETKESEKADRPSVTQTSTEALEAQGKKAPIPATPAKEEKSTVSGFDRWLSIKNAEYFRNNCHLYTPFLFQQPGDYDLVFVKVLSEFWHGFGNVQVRREFPEIHVEFLTVNVYRLRDTWNRRDIDLKQAVLTELRRAFVEFARSRGYDFTAWSKHLVTDVWKNLDTLIIEVPCSPFPFTHPGLIPALAPEEYLWLKRQLAARSEL